MPRSGWHHTDDARAKIALARVGWHHSAESRAKMSQAHTLRYAQGAAHARWRAVITPAGQFKSLRLAAEFHGVSRLTVTRRIKRQVAGWCYA